MTQQRLNQVRDLARALDLMASHEQNICRFLWAFAALWCVWWGLFLFV